MPKINVYNQSGEKVSDITLSDYVFGIEPHQQALFDVVNAQRAAMRQGTHSVKDRSEVSGGGRKPWRQKGTGRARHGSIRSPLWRTGGVTFGPTPRSYKVKLNQKVRNLALRSALSYQLKEGQLKVVDMIQFDEPKTKAFVQFLNNLEITGKTLVVDKAFSENVIYSGQNIPGVSYSLANHISVYDILNAKNLILTVDAVESLEEVLGND